MDIQVPTKFANGKLPSRKEILNHISLLKLEGPQKDRVRIREHVYDVNEYGLVTYEEKTLRLPEVADYVHNLEEVFDGILTLLLTYVLTCVQRKNLKL